MKRQRIFYFSATADAWIHAGPALARAFPEHAFDAPDKIEFLTCKRIDLTDEELAALPEIDSRKVRREPK